MFSISHSLLSIALPHVLLTVLISSTCTLLGTPSFPQYLSLSVSSCVCSFVRLSTSVLALSYQAFSVLSSQSQYLQSQSYVFVRPAFVCVQVPSPATVSVCPGTPSPSSSAWLRPTSAPDFESAYSLEPRFRLPGSDPRLPHDHEPELPSTSLFADNDPCLSYHELP